MDNIQIDDFDRVLRINNDYAGKEKLTPEELSKFREYLDYGLTFNRDYTWGYISALLDMMYWFETNLITDLFSSLQVPKTLKTMHKFMKFALENREVLRNRSYGDYYIGFNKEEDKFYCKKAR